MTKSILISCLLLFLVNVISAQHVPMGMKYQAVARDLKGQVLSDRNLQLRISLYTDVKRKDIAYSEVHKTITSAQGLFSLTIGEGHVSKGKFSKVPWSSEDVWMEVAIMADDYTEFVVISDSRMLSVPYAFHAATASELTGEGSSRGAPDDPYTKAWHLLANSNTQPGRDKLGTADLADLVIVTNNTERVRIMSDGDVNVVNSQRIGKDLSVGRDVFLNTEVPTVFPPGYVSGQTINYGKFTVENGSSTYLTGSLTVDGPVLFENTLDVEGATHLHSTLSVDGATDLNSTLNVDGATHLHGTLSVDGATDLNSSLNVDGLARISNTTQSTSVATGALVVDGGLGIAKNLYVGGSANFGGPAIFGDILEITNTTQSTASTNGALIVAGGAGIGKNLNVGGQLGVRGSNTGFMANITNMDGNTGDGLEIRLGRTHPAWNGSAYLHLTSPGAEIFDNAIATIDGWINGAPFDPLDILDFIPSAYIAGTACNLVNLLTEQLNESIGLPASINGFQILPPLTIVPEIDLDPFGSIGPYGTPEIRFPTIQVIPAIPQIPICSSFPSFTLPVISFVDVNNSLTNENQFLSFKDKDNRELGSVRAQSVSDWQLDYFDGAYFVDVLAGIVGIDFVSGIASVINTFTQIADSHNSLGVEYASGNGDYAEWLERQNADEWISAGDIVAVQSGKITKDLHQAEQVMAVSHRPIMLGNAPESHREHLGNKIAFMGQVPVKIQGPVTSGDYIVGNSSTPGYGIAVQPNHMTPEQAQLIVGRAWETNIKPGPKMVNTVIGVDNGNFLKMVQDQQAQVQLLEKRLSQLEDQMGVFIQAVQKAEAVSAELEKSNAKKMEQFKTDQADELEQQRLRKAERRGQ